MSHNVHYRRIRATYAVIACAMVAALGAIGMCGAGGGGARTLALSVNAIPKATGPASLGNSALTDDGTTVVSTETVEVTTTAGNEIGLTITGLSPQEEDLQWASGTGGRSYLMGNTAPASPGGVGFTFRDVNTARDVFRVDASDNFKFPQSVSIDGPATNSLLEVDQSADSDVTRPGVRVDGSPTGGAAPTPAGPAMMAFFPNPYPADWQPGTYIGKQGEIVTNAWVIISGTPYPQTPASADPSMLSIKSDIIGPAIQVRNAAAGSWIFSGLSGSDGHYVFSIYDDGMLKWGATDHAGEDTNLYRAQAGVLKTDGSLVVAGNEQIGTPNAAVSSPNMLAVSGHRVATGPSPTLSSCGTGPSVVHGDDGDGWFITGAATTSCELDFAEPYSFLPACTVDVWGSSTRPVYQPLAADITLSVAIASTAYVYHCWNPNR